MEVGIHEKTNDIISLLYVFVISLTVFIRSLDVREQLKECFLSSGVIINPCDSYTGPCRWLILTNGVLLHGRKQNGWNLVKDTRHYW